MANTTRDPSAVNASASATPAAIDPHAHTHSAEACAQYAAWVSMQYRGVVSVLQQCHSSSGYMPDALRSASAPLREIVQLLRAPSLTSEQLAALAAQVQNTADEIDRITATGADAADGLLTHLRDVGLYRDGFGVTP